MEGAGDADSRFGGRRAVALRFAAVSAALVTAAVVVVDGAFVRFAPAQAGGRFLLCLLGVAGLLWGSLLRLVYLMSVRLRRELARNQYQALHDGLTGLANRRLMLDRLEQALAHGRRTGEHTAVLLLDLDGFKNVNDTLGHQQGDRVLVEVADRLRGALRAGDTLARLGGDEFGVLLGDVRNCGDDDPLMPARRLVAALVEPFALDDNAVKIGVSVGVACAPSDADSVERLWQCADTAMYAAKAAASGVMRYAQGGPRGA